MPTLRSVEHQTVQPNKKSLFYVRPETSSFTNNSTASGSRHALRLCRNRAVHYVLADPYKDARTVGPLTVESHTLPHSKGVTLGAHSLTVEPASRTTQLASNQLILGTAQAVVPP
jgi:hypothetical protein